MDMVATIVPNMIAPDLVSVQALENRVGMINILQFAYGSNKGTAQRDEVFASALGYQGMNVSYTSASVDGEAITADGSGKATLAYTPVKAGTIRAIAADGTVVTPTLDDAYTGEISGLTASTDYTVYYLYDNETVPVQAPSIKMDIKSIPIQTTSRKLTAVWAFDAAYELSKEYGADMLNVCVIAA